MKKELLEFKNFVSNYNMKDLEIKHKYDHSIRVMKIGNIIAKKLNLSDEEVYMITLSCLLHDLGRFDQWRDFKTFKDEESFDHGDYAYNYITDNNYLRKYTDNDKYDKEILFSIKNHNKYEIEKSSDSEVLFAKIVRDSDKVDILLSGSITMFLNYKKNDYSISDLVYNCIMNEFAINYKDTNNTIEIGLVGLAMIYDLNFKFSFDFINGHNIVNNTISILKSKCTNKKTLEKLDKINKKINNYIKEMSKNGKEI